MLRVKTDEHIFNYRGDGNFIVVPIASNPDHPQGVVPSGNMLNLVMNEHRQLRKRWFFYIREGVTTPVFRTAEGGGYIGLIVSRGRFKDIEEELIEEGLYRIEEFLEENPNAIVYFADDWSHVYEIQSERAVYLEGVKVPYVKYERFK